MQKILRQDCPEGVLILKNAEVEKLADILQYMGMDRKLILKNLYRCDRYFIDELFKILL